MEGEGFTERFNFLMELTGTKNSVLGHAISFDPSYISKLRSGKRKMPHNPEFLEAAAAFFARRIVNEYQAQAISDRILGGEPLPATAERTAKLLGDYLVWGSRAEDADGAALRPFPMWTYEGSAAQREEDAALGGQELPEAVAAYPYYGAAGKRRAVEQFLKGLENVRGVRLLLYSDEEMSWLYEDAAFARRWAQLLQDLLARGARVTIIHTLSRNLNDLLEAVQKWMPLYLAGNIEPYYCPRLRDGIHRRSVFVASGHSALVSNSVMERGEGMANLLYYDKSVVTALEQEYANFLTLCRPLMRIYRGGVPTQGLIPQMDYALSGHGRAYVAGSVPSLYSMPPEVAAALGGQEGDALRRYDAERMAWQAHLDAGAQIVEIISLPDVASVDAGKVAHPVFSLMGGTPQPYTRVLLEAHLRAALRRMETEAGYRLVVAEDVSEGVYIISSIKCCFLYLATSGCRSRNARAAHSLTVSGSQGEAGAILLYAPYAVFRMDEQHICAALYEYLSQYDSEDHRRRAREQVESYLGSLADA